MKEKPGPAIEPNLDHTLLLTKSELAKHLRVSERQVDNLRDELPKALTIGSVPRWSRQGVVEWISERTGSVANSVEVSA